MVNCFFLLFSWIFKMPNCPLFLCYQLINGRQYADGRYFSFSNPCRFKEETKIEKKMYSMCFRCKILLHNKLFLLLPSVLCCTFQYRVLYVASLFDRQSNNVQLIQFTQFVHLVRNTLSLPVQLFLDLFKDLIGTFALLWKLVEFLV